MNIKPAPENKCATTSLTSVGEPVAALSPPHRARKGLRLEAIDAFKKKHGVETIFPNIPEDFDAPLPEDFLLRPLPPDA